MAAADAVTAQRSGLGPGSFEPVQINISIFAASYRPQARTAQLRCRSRVEPPQSAEAFTALHLSLEAHVGVGDRRPDQPAAQALRATLYVVDSLTRMVRPIRGLIDRLRQPRSRTQELVALRRLFAIERSRRRPSDEERALARYMRELRAALTLAIGAVSSCGGCARALPAPEGTFAGGHCCSGPTDDRFSAAEVAALVIAGTRNRVMVAPRGEHAGCAFRDHDRCALAPVDRPNICALYLCRELRRELHARGDSAKVQALLDELDASFARFVKLRDDRLLCEELASIDPRLVGPEAPRQTKES